MLFADRLLFLHVPKTGGMSVTQFLIDNLPGRITVLIPPETPSSPALPPVTRTKLHAKRLLRRLRIPGLFRVTYADGLRHERMGEAAAALARFGRRLEDFETILAVIRNPYDLEVSRYHFLRGGYLGVAGLAQGRAQKIAFQGDFLRFARTAPYLGRLPARIEDWYETDGGMPQNLRLLRFESLEDDLVRFVGPLHPRRRKLAKLNASPHEPYQACLTAQSEEAVYRKYQWLFDRGFYKREQFPSLPAQHDVEIREHA